MKRMKDIIPIDQHRLWENSYLNRLVSMEKRRQIIFKELLINKKMKAHDAYKLSLRRMK